MPTTGEIVILQRVGDSRAAAPRSARIAPGRVTLAGEVDAVGGLVDVINFILSQQWSGQLAIVDGAARKTIYFKRGDVRTAASNVPEDRLGAILYRYGVISDAELQAAVAAAAGTAKLGQILVEQGKLTPHDLYTYVRKQVEEIFFSVLVMRAGAFYFYRTDEDHGPVSQLSLSTKQLLFDGVRRIDELGYFREKLPSNAAGAAAPPSAAGRPSSTRKEERVLQLVDGARDLPAIARQSHLGEFETTKVLYQLLTSGFLDTKPEPVVKLSTARGDSLQDIFGKVVDAFNEVYAKIFTRRRPARQGAAAPQGPRELLRLGRRVRAAVRRPGDGRQGHARRASTSWPTSTWRPPTTSSTTCTAGSTSCSSSSCSPPARRSIAARRSSCTSASTRSSATAATARATRRRATPSIVAEPGDANEEAF